MNKKIANLLKYNKFLYSIYYKIFGSLINIISVFVKTDKELILFNSFAGRKFDDSPKAIFEAMKKDERFRGYKIVWAFHNPDDFSVEGAVKLKTDGMKYFITALQSGVWITNSSVERGLKFKKDSTFYFNTWHGTPIKLMGKDISSDNQSFKASLSFVLSRESIGFS